jgi:transcriptional regulator with XRE-family HTH domain
MKRLIQYFDYMGLQPEEANRIFGITSRTQTAYEAGERAPTYEGLMRIISISGLNASYLIEQSDDEMWAPEIVAARALIQKKAPELEAKTSQERARMLVELIQEAAPITEQPWFMPGILGVSEEDYKNFMLEHPLGELSGLSLRRLAEFLKVSPTWLSLGRKELFIQPIDTKQWERWSGMIDHLEGIGISPENVSEHLPVIRKLVLNGN